MIALMIFKTIDDGVDRIIVYMIHAYPMLVIWVDPFWYSSLPCAMFFRLSSPIVTVSLRPWSTNIGLQVLRCIELLVSLPLPFLRVLDAMNEYQV
jgi:hypothetical protein